MGPFNSPLALGKQLWSAAIWVLSGAVVFNVLIFQLAISIAPELFYETVDVRADSFFWAVNIVGCIASGLMLFAITEWSRWIGAGYFAGSLRADRSWFWIALVASPIVWITITFVMSAIMGGGGDWVYSDEQSAEFASLNNRTMASIFYAVLLAPLLEEVLYRGVGMGAILSKGGHPFLAIGLTSTAFASIHLQYSPAAMFIVFLGGLWFGALRVLSGSVGVPIVGHISINAVLILLQS